MAKMIDLGETFDDDSVDFKPNKKHFPSFFLEKVKLPFKPEDVGKDFDITGTIHVKNVGEATSESGTKREFQFELRKMAVTGKAKKNVRVKIKRTRT